MRSVQYAILCLILVVACMALSATVYILPHWYKIENFAFNLNSTTTQSSQASFSVAWDYGVWGVCLRSSFSLNTSDSHDTITTQYEEHEDFFAYNGLSTLHFPCRNGSHATTCVVQTSICSTDVSNNEFEFLSSLRKLSPVDMCSKTAKSIYLLEIIHLSVNGANTLLLISSFMLSQRRIHLYVRMGSLLSFFNGVLSLCVWLMFLISTYTVEGGGALDGCFYVHGLGTILFFSLVGTCLLFCEQYTKERLIEYKSPCRSINIPSFSSLEGISENAVRVYHLPSSL